MPDEPAEGRGRKAVDRGGKAAELAQVESALRISEERLALALEAATDGLYDWTTPDGPVYLSARFYTMLGYEPDEFTPSRDAFLSLVHPDDYERISGILLAYVEKLRESHSFETRLRCKDGHYIWILSRGRVVARYPDGRPRRIVGTQVDITTIKSSEEALRESEDRYRSVVSAMHEGVIILSGAGIVSGCNRRAAEILGLGEEELLGRSAGDPGWQPIREDGTPFPEDEHPSLVSLRTGRAVVGTTMGVRKPTGELVWLMINSEPVLDAASSAAKASVVTFTDFTARKRAEDELRTKESAMATAISGLAIADAKGRLIYGNPSFLRMWGYEREEEVLGRNATRFWQSKDQAIRIFTSLGNGGSWVGELTGRRKDGSLFEAQLAASIVRDPTGAPRLMLASVLDITDLKRQEIALRHAAERLRTVIANTPVVLFALDQEGVFTLSEGKGLEVLGLRPGQIVGLSVFDVYRDFPGILGAVRRALAGEVLNAEAQVGELFFEVWYEPLRNHRHEVTGAIGVATDITVRKQAEKERASLMEQLVQAQRMESVGRLAGGVAHDFNNLLTVINGYSDLLMAKLDKNDPHRAPLGEIRKAGDRAAELTRQLLTLSRKQVVEPAPVNLNALIAESLEMLRRLAGEQVEVVAHLSRDLAEVISDAGQMHQVLMNLVANARDAMPGGGRLTIETTNFEVDYEFAAHHSEIEPGPHVLLVVADTGVGMSSGVKRHIFEPFYTTKGVGRGTGLGLSTVYGIVRQSGGCVWVESEPGRGAVFKIALPQARSRATPRDEQKSQAATLGGHETVLVVEDQIEVRKLACEILRGHGYQVLEASMAFDALLIAEQHQGPIHLMLTDCVMPGMSGRELAAEMVYVRPATKVLFMTGYADELVGQQPPNGDGVDLIFKPFGPDELAQRVRSMLGL